MSRICYLFLLLTASSSLFSQWTKVPDIHSWDIIDVVRHSNSLVAASLTNEIFICRDGEEKWTSRKIGPDTLLINTLFSDFQVLYVGTVNSGIYSSTDGGISWRRNDGDFFAVSSFARKGEDLFAATFGSGVVKLDPALGRWNSFNAGLPNYAGNVYSIISTPQSLLITAGANGALYRYNFSRQQWEEELFYGQYAPGLEIQQMLLDSNVLYAVNGNRILRSENDGKTWIPDHQGAKNGIDRKIFRIDGRLFLLTNLLSGGSYLQTRQKNAVAGSSWGQEDSFIPGGYAYGLLHFNKQLYLAHSNGLFVQQTVTDIRAPEAEHGQIRIFPNPGKGSEIFFESEQPVSHWAIRTLNGQLLYRGRSPQTSPQPMAPLPPGIFILQVFLNNGEVRPLKFVVTG